MTIRFEKYTSGSAIHTIWGAMAILFLVTVGLYRNLAGLLPPCFFNELTGLPCLTCGATRSAISLSMFDLPSSFLYNPLLPLLFIGLLAFSIFHLVSFILKKKISLRFAESGKRNIRIAVITLIAINWVYLIAAGI